MPTYEYVCSSCGNHFDTVQSFSDPPLERCEICGGQLRRVFHPAGILFKGSGFYSTDNRRVGPSGKARSGDKSEQSGDKSERSGDKAAAKSSESSSSEGSKKAAEKSA